MKGVLMNSKTISVFFPGKERVVNPSEFIHLVETNRDNIDRVTFISGRIGSRNFGKFKVKLNSVRHEQPEYALQKE
jgi:hypothetical protein